MTSLLEHGADPESQDGKLKLTPLMIGQSLSYYYCEFGNDIIIIACQNGHSEVVKILLENGQSSYNH